MSEDIKNRCQRCSGIASFFKILFTKNDEGKYVEEKVCYKCINKYNPPRRWRQYSNPSNKEKTDR